MTYEKDFPKTISQWEFDYGNYGLLTNLTRIIVTCLTFLWVYSNSEELSYFFWQNTYPNLKTTCHINLKFFLWTKLLENLLLAKYLISVAAPLSCLEKKFSNYFNLTSKTGLLDMLHPYLLPIWQAAFLPLPVYNWMNQVDLVVVIRWDLVLELGLKLKKSKPKMLLLLKL